MADAEARTEALRLKGAMAAAAASAMEGKRLESELLQQKAAARTAEMAVKTAEMAVLRAGLPQTEEPKPAAALSEESIRWAAQGRVYWGAF